MRRRRHHFRVSPFPPEIKAVLAVLDHFDKIFETSPEMKKVISYLRLQAVLTLKIEISPAIKFLIDVRKGKQAWTRTLAQECHWRNSTFESEFNEIIPTLKELILLNIEQPLIRWWIKWDIDWLYPDESFSKEELRDFGKWVSLDVVGASYVRRAISTVDRFLAFSSRWPKFHAKELDNLLNMYRQTLLEFSSVGEQVSEYISNLQNFREGILQDEMTKACGKVTRRSGKDDFAAWDFYMKGQSPVEIARKVFPFLPKKVALERVRRRLARCQRMIYGSESTDKKMLRLTSFDPSKHLKSCEECKVAKKSDDCCRLMQDYLNQESHYQRERQIPRVRFEDNDKEIEPSDHFSEDDMIEETDGRLEGNR
jgi:hypothetical protein